MRDRRPSAALGNGPAHDADRWLEGGDTVGVGALRFDVRHCPGHTPGHVVFVQPGAALAAWVRRPADADRMRLRAGR